MEVELPAVSRWTIGLKIVYVILFAEVQAHCNGNEEGLQSHVLPIQWNSFDVSQALSFTAELCFCWSSVEVLYKFERAPTAEA